MGSFFQTISNYCSLILLRGWRPLNSPFNGKRSRIFSMEIVSSSIYLKVLQVASKLMIVEFLTIKMLKTSCLLICLIRLGNGWQEACFWYHGLTSADVGPVPQIVLIWSTQKFTSTKYVIRSGIHEHVLQMDNWMQEDDLYGANIKYGTKVYMI